MAYRGIKIKKGNSVAIDTSKQWGIYVKDSPYIPIPKKQKNIASQSWLDENGDDEFIPTEAYYEPVEATIQFLYRGTIAQANTAIKSFYNYITNCWFSFYDEYHKIGRQNVRLLEFPDEFKFTYESGNASDDEIGLAEFTVTFKINDCVTDIVL